MDNLLEKYIQELQQVDTILKYEKCFKNLNQMLYDEGYSPDVIQMVKAKGRYMVNKFSDESTLENMLKAKENLIFYLEGIRHQSCMDTKILMQDYLSKYLHNFYFFLEAFKEIKPHKKATLNSEMLQNIQIKNEYDLQHLLYAVLKPLYGDARVEVTEDAGCGAIRSDIKITALNTIIETKCTRETMSLKKLTEEIEADIVHYEVDFLYFYVYDKEKIVKDKEAFEATFNRVFDGKHIEVIILQPIYM